MMKRTSWMSALAALGVLTVTGVAAASSHREAPAIADDPAADNTDTYAWVQGSNLVVVANYIGLELPEGGPNWAKFSDNVLYQIHIARGGTSLADALTYNIQFTTGQPFSVPATQPPLAHLPNTGGQEFFAQLAGSHGSFAGSGAFAQTYTVTQITGNSPASATVIASGIPVPPPNVGPGTNAIVYGIPSGMTYENFFVDPGNTQKTLGTLTFPNGGGTGQVFAGPRDDPFFVDLGPIFDLAQLRPVAAPTGTVRDSIQYMNVHSIVLQIPLTVANGGTAPTSGLGNAAQTVGVWASASRRKVTIARIKGGDASLGPWVQVSRLGLPLVNEAIIGLQDKDYWNHLTPSDDAAVFAPYFENPILVRDAEAVGFYAAANPDAGTSGGPLVGCTGSGLGGSDLEHTTKIVSTISLNNTDIGQKDTGITTVGDVLRVDLGGASGFPNGRLLTDDVVSTELDLILCYPAFAAGQDPFTGLASPAANEAPLPKTINGTATFPYLAPPWEGRSANPRPAPN